MASKQKARAVEAGGVGKQKCQGRWKHYLWVGNNLYCWCFIAVHGCLHAGSKARERVGERRVLLVQGQVFLGGFSMAEALVVAKDMHVAFRTIKYTAQRCKSSFSLKD